MWWLSIQWLLGRAPPASCAPSKRASAAAASWARMLAIVFGCFSLLDIPLGTALGIYTLWVLLPARSEEEYRQMARVG